MPGTITFRPLEANLTHNTDLLTKMNPYCSFILGNQKFNSAVCKKGGKHPHWNDSVTIPTSTETIAVIELMDKDRLSKDDVIGGCSINLQEIQAQGPTRNWYPLFYKNKPAGEILVETTFQGDLLGQGSLGGAGFGGAGFTTQTVQQDTLLQRDPLFQQQAGFVSGQTGFVSGQTGFVSGQTGFVGRQEERLLAAGQPSGVIVEEQRTGLIEGNLPERRVFTEQHQVVEPHTFLKNVEVTETVPVQKQIEVLESRKVLRDVEYTQAVPVTKQIEVVEPQVVMKEVEVIEPRVVTKTIQVVENVPVKKQVEVVEMRHDIRNVETFEPQTFTKQVEVTEQVPVLRNVTVTEPVTVQKTIEFVEPIITTQTITKEVIEPVVVNQSVHTEVGPATLIGQVETQAWRGERQVTGQWTQEQRLLEEQRLQAQGFSTINQQLGSTTLTGQQWTGQQVVGGQQWTGQQVVGGQQWTGQQVVGGQPLGTSEFTSGQVISGQAPVRQGLGQRVAETWNDVKNENRGTFNARP